MKLKSKIWKYLTAFVVLLIILNPEMVQLALFIDAIGLEMFLMLLEVQILAVVSVFFNNKIKPLLNFIKCFYVNYIPSVTLKNIKETPEGLALASQSPAILMCLLVFSAAIGMALNVYK